MRIVAISGSLRAQSSNGALLRAAASVAPAGVEVELYEELGTLPHFNPDLDEEGMTPPPAVASLRARLGAADAVILCSPEYAHGMPGALKNALDWLVSVGALVGKPTAVINASPTSGEHAQAQLVEVLTTMSWRVVAEACLRIQFSRSRVQNGRVDEDTVTLLRRSLDALVAAGTCLPLQCGQ
ncbi:MAG: NADPH-dependent reductase [bacterium]|nr:NADPH-dependent reductase [bacterium]